MLDALLHLQGDRPRTLDRLRRMPETASSIPFRRSATCARTNAECVAPIASRRNRNSTWRGDAHRWKERSPRCVHYDHSEGNSTHHIMHRRCSQAARIGDRGDRSLHRRSASPAVACLCARGSSFNIECRRRIMERLVVDARFAVRSLRGSSSFLLATCAVLSIGIGTLICPFAAELSREAATNIDVNQDSSPT